jgi:hypothetical protein
MNSVIIFRIDKFWSDGNIGRLTVLTRIKNNGFAKFGL